MLKAVDPYDKPPMPEGDLRVLAVLGPDLNAYDWAYRLCADVKTIVAAFGWLSRNQWRLLA